MNHCLFFSNSVFTVGLYTACYLCSWKNIVSNVFESNTTRYIDLAETAPGPPVPVSTTARSTKMKFDF
jgi:hypothetical protein